MHNFFYMRAFTLHQIKCIKTIIYSILFTISIVHTFLHFSHQIQLLIQLILSPNLTEKSLKKDYFTNFTNILSPLTFNHFTNHSSFSHPWDPRKLILLAILCTISLSHLMVPPPTQYYLFGISKLLKCKPYTNYGKLKI